MLTDWGFPDFDDHEGVHLFSDRDSGLSAIIAIHSTKLGPAAGGVRFWHYAGSDAAITDALRLSRGMSYKNAMAGLELGGGKGVILANEPGDGPIKSFTLRGIKDSPPYLHDGRCFTLEDTVEFFNLVLELKLTQEEKADLVAFMKCL